MARGPVLLAAFLAAATAALGACAPVPPPPVVVLPGPGYAAPACDTRFRVANESSAPVRSLYVSHTSRDDWGADQLRDAILPPGRAALYRAPDPGEYDFRVVWTDRRAAELRRVNICTVLQITITDAGLRASHVNAAAAAAARVRPPPPAAAAAAPPPPPAVPGRLATGTGFVVARDRVMTNRHVVEGCGAVTLRTADGRELHATLPPLRSDPRRDLALLAVPGDPGPALAFRPGPPRRGEGVVTYGFPLAGLLSSGPTLTTGEVSALSGLADDQAQMQISAPVQPGSSGGPLLDRRGQVVGVVVAKLNAARIAARMGDIPQNVNFAIKGEEAIAFLREAGLRPTIGAAGSAAAAAERSAAEVGEIAHPSTVMVRCRR
jgi:S1-C subfamily serine protease